MRRPPVNPRQLMFVTYRCILKTRGSTDGFLLLMPKDKDSRIGGEERRLMHLVPAPAERLMKRRVLSRPGVNSLVHSYKKRPTAERFVHEIYTARPVDEEVPAQELSSCLLKPVLCQ